MFKRQPEVTPAFSLTDEEILERLRIKDEKVVATIYTICLDMLYKEEDRAKNLDTKGSTLLGVSGLTSTVVFSLGGLLIEKITNVPLPVIGQPMFWLTLLYISASMTLLGCILTAVLAIRTRSDLKWVSEGDVFNESVVSDESTYKRYMAAHYWSVFRSNFGINEFKGRRLKTGYWLFFAALIQLLPIIIIIGAYSYQKGTLTKPPASATPCSCVTRTSIVFENTTGKPVPTQKPSGGSNTTRGGGSGAGRLRRN